MSTVERLQSVIPGQTAAWYTRIATEVDAGRMPMPCLEPAAVTPKPAAVTPGKDYTAHVKAIGFGLLTSYFVIFVSTSSLVWLAIGSFFLADRLKAVN